MDRRVTLHHNKRQPTDTNATAGTAGSNSELTSTSGVPEISASEEEQGSVNLQPFPKVEGSLSPRGSPLTVGPKQVSLPERTSRSRKSSWSSDTANSRRLA